MTQVWPLQKDCPAFYGDPGNHPEQWQAWEAANLTTVPCPWVLHMDKKVITKITIHKKCAASLTTVLNNVWDAVGKSQAEIERLKFDQFSGSYNQRPMRGGSARSMHGYGAAIDFDYDDNQFHATKHLFTDSTILIVKFKEEGWAWGGDWSPGSVDAMHVQAARVH